MLEKCLNKYVGKNKDKKNELDFCNEDQILNHILESDSN